MKARVKKEKPRKKSVRKSRKEAYVPHKALFGDADDYAVYQLSRVERLQGGSLGFLAGFLVTAIFFHSLILSAAAGVCLIPAGVKIFRDYRKKKRLRNLLFQFRDMLEALSASYSAAKNARGAFEDAYGDMAELYGAKADIVRELKLILAGVYNGKGLEELLHNFALRSHLDDIESFAAIFEVTNQYGGDMKKVISDTTQIISDKIEMELEIQTLLTANRNELNLMIVMPLVIMLSLNGMGDMSVVQNTPANVLVKCAALVIFGSAYLLGRKIVDIKL